MLQTSRSIPRIYLFGLFLMCFFGDVSLSFGKKRNCSFVCFGGKGKRWLMVGHLVLIECTAGKVGWKVWRKVERDLFWWAKKLQGDGVFMRNVPSDVSLVV